MSQTTVKLESLENPTPVGVVQGELKTVTVFCENLGGFVAATSTAITIAIVDSTGTKVTIADASVTHILENAKWQIFSFPISAVNSAALAAGFCSLEVSIDTVKAHVHNALLVTKAL